MHVLHEQIYACIYRICMHVACYASAPVCVCMHILHVAMCTYMVVIKILMTILVLSVLLQLELRHILWTTGNQLEASYMAFVMQVGRKVGCT